jgi:hypothetical protein
MTPVLTRPRPAPARSARIIALIVAGTLLVLLAVAWIAKGTGGPKFVDRVSVVNTTDFHLEVELSGAEGSRSLALGTVERGRTKTFGQVIDQGDTWVFRLLYGGELGGRITVSRSELERNRWRLRVPESVGQRLLEAGLIPPPG